MILCLKKRPAAQTGKNPHFFQGFLNLPQQLLLPGLKNCQNRFKVDAPRLDRFPLILFRAVGRSKNLKGAISNVQCLDRTGLYSPLIVFSLKTIAIKTKTKTGFASYSAKI